MPGKIIDKKEVLRFLQEFGKFIAASWVQQAGFALNTMMVGWYHEENLLLAWIAASNLQVYVYFCGMGLSNGLRSIMSYELGRGNFKKGKHVAK